MHPTSWQAPPSSQQPQRSRRAVLHLQSLHLLELQQLHLRDRLSILTQKAWRQTVIPKERSD